MRALLPIGAAVLLAAGGGVGVLSDRARETPRTAPGPAALLGGFSALAVQVLTIRAGDAADRGDPARALVYYDLVMELEPQLVRGADWIAGRVGLSMAGDEPDPEASWALMREGLRIHDRSVAANPGSAEARMRRGRYLLVRFAASGELAARFGREVGTSPYEAALPDLRAAVAGDPEDIEALDLLGIAALYAARDHLAAGDLEGAAAAATEARDADRAALDRYRAGGVEVGSKEWALSLAESLLAVLAAPPAERPARYGEFWQRFGGPDGLPGLPEPGAVRW